MEERDKRRPSTNSIELTETNLNGLFTVTEAPGNIYIDIRDILMLGGILKRSLEIFGIGRF